MSQSAAILAELRRTPGQWVSLPRLAEVSGAYAVHSRAADLRADGHNIENRIQRRPDGTRLSFYRLAGRLTQATLPIMTN